MRVHRSSKNWAAATVAAAVFGTFAAVAPGSGAAGAAVSSPAAAEYTAGVSQICAGALLFDGRHQEGTRSDALSIARAIRASTARRLARVTALSVPAELETLNNRWISSQRQLAALFARTWVRIYDAIDAAHTPTQRTTLAQRLEKLIHTPDRLKRSARTLEHLLHVPDCTGGG